MKDSINRGLVSIITPVYNTSECLIRKAVESILNQTYKSFELILIDDGSKDSCAMVLDSIASCDQRIRIIHKVNEGVSSARNYGLREAKGEFICFLDADDTYAMGFLAEAVAEMTLGTENVDIVYGKTEWVSDLCVEKTNYSDKQAHRMDYDVSTEENKLFFLKRLMFYNSGDYAYDGFQPEIWCKLYRRKCIEDLYFDKDLRIGEDMIFSAKCVMKATKIAIVNSVWYRYYLNTQSAMHSYSPTRVESYKKLYDAFSKFCNENSCTALLPIRTFHLTGEMLWPCLDLADAKEIIRIERELYHHSDVAKVLKKIQKIDNQVTSKIVTLYNLGIDYYFLKICLVLLKRRIFSKMRNGQFGKREL